MTSRIIGVGNYIPTQTITNLFFDKHHFLDESGKSLKQDNATIADKLKEITGIEERRYAQNDQVTSDLGFIAAQNAIENSGIDPETLDYIIFARSEEHTSELQSRENLVCRLLLEKKKSTCTESV